MPTIYQVQDKCRRRIRALVEKGELVCDRFTPDPANTNICVMCDYSEFIHLCKEVTEAK